MVTAPPPRPGLYARAIALISVVLVMITAIVTYAYIHVQNDKLTAALERRLDELVTGRAVSVSNALWELNTDSVRAILRGLATDPDFVAATLLDDKGRVFATVGDEGPDMPHVRAEAPVTVEHGGATRRIGTLSLALSRAGLLESQRTVARNAVVLGVIQLIAIVAAVAWGLRTVLHPIETITRRMTEIAEGELDAEVPYGTRPDHIGDLSRAATAFQQASAERARTQSQLEQAHREMEKRVEERTEALRQAEALFRSVIAASPAEIFARDRDGRMLLVNRAWEREQRTTEAEVIGKTIWDLMPPDRAQVYAEQDRAVIESGASIDREIPLPFGDQTRTLHTIKFPLFDASDRIIGVGGITTDVTDHREVQNTLQQAQKMESVGQLTGGIAHDFNNLLAVIQGNAELLDVKSAPRRARVDAILRATGRGAELTQRLLAFSRQQPLHPRPVDLGQTVAGMSQLFTRTLMENIEIHTRVPGSLWLASVDPGQVENALLNLAINARDAMPDGGRLTIDCSNRTLDEDYAKHNPDVAAGDYVLLAVTDDGTGMTAQTRARAFEPFFTTKDVGSGTGLGLSMVYGFARQSGGHVAIYSEEGHGTTVRLYLPRAFTANDEPGSDRGEEPMPRGAGERILVIEDDDDVRALALSMLETLGYACRGVLDAAAARDLLDAGETFDLVLSDVVLPGGTSGPAFAREAMARHPGLGFVFMSGYPAQATSRNGLLEAGETLLTKPFQRVELARTVAQALRTTS